MKKIILTGCAGFIGFHLCKKLLLNDYEIIGIDNLNSYYDINLKKARLEEIKNISKKKKLNWTFKLVDLTNKNDLDEIFEIYQPSLVIHLAAQAGVRFSISHPEEYINANLVGFFNIIESCRKHNVEQFLYASSSSVYGDNLKVPFKESSSTNRPVSLYAATKKSNELIAYSYSHLYKIKTIGMRFFTVYGPWGRPDMAPMIFTKAILSGSKIKIFNNGENYRDFTYIDDVIEVIFRLIRRSQIKTTESNVNFSNKSQEKIPYEIFNIGNSKSINILKFLEILEKEIGKKAEKDFIPMQLGDVIETFADTKKIEDFIGFKPNTNLDTGIKKFVEWYKTFY